MCSAAMSKHYLKVAAIALGFQVEHIPGTPNAWVGLNVVRERL